MPCVFEWGPPVTCLQLADVLQVVDIEEDRDARHVGEELVKVRIRVRVRARVRVSVRIRARAWVRVGLGLSYLPLDVGALVLAGAPDVR